MPYKWKFNSKERTKVTSDLKRLKLERSDKIASVTSNFGSLAKAILRGLKIFDTEPFWQKREQRVPAWGKIQP
jgi:hypothetical protein